MLAGGLRLYAISTAPPGLYLDEAADGANAVQAWETGDFKVFYTEDNGREGLYINVAAVSIHFFGANAWAVRLPATIFGVLTVWGVYALAAELVSPVVGLSAAFFLATSYWHLNFSRIAFRSIGAPCFLVWALYFLLVAFRRLRTGRMSAGWMVVTGFLYGLGFHTYTAYRVTPVIVIAMLSLLFVEARNGGYLRRYWAAVLIFTLSAAAVTYPLAAYAMNHSDAFNGRMKQVSVFSSAQPVFDIARNIWTTAKMLYWQGDGNLRHNYAGRAEVFWPVAVMMTLGIAIAARRLFGQSKRTSVLLLLWMVCGGLPAVLSDGGLPHALRSILMLPPIVILAGIGAEVILARLQRRVLGTALSVIVVGSACLLATETTYRYFWLWAPDPRTAEWFDGSMVQLSAQVNSLPADKTRVVAIEGKKETGDPFFLPFVTLRYLTRSVTAKQQDQANLHFYTPSTFPGRLAKELAPDFCAQVRASMPDASVVCLNAEQ